MTIECRSFNANGYLMNPTVDALHKLHLQEKGCSHFLLFSYPANRKPQLTETNVPVILGKLDTLMDGGKIYIKDIDANVQCINRQIYLSNGSAIQLDVVASGYTVLGAIYDKESDTLYVYWPNSIESAHFAVSVEIKYQVRRHTVEEGSFLGFKVTGFLGHLSKPKQVETDFCEVFFNAAPDYIDGSITYTIGDNPYKYPITKAMLGRWILIKSPLGSRLPEFTASDSISLQKVESNHQV